MIITDESLLRVKCSDILPEEIGPLKDQLERELEHSAKQGRPGIGLAAPQIGVAKRFAIIRVSPDKQVDLANCKIENGYDKSVFDREGCLSFPDKYEKTLRYQEIHVTNNIVEPYSFISTGLLSVVIQHECLPYNSMIHTENGLKKIGEIVNTRYNGKVLCMDENNNFVFMPIINWSKKRNLNKKWIKLKISNGNTGPNKNLYCTEDHLCATIDDILFLNQKIYFIKAKDLCHKYIIRIPNNNIKNSEQKLYNKEQISSIIGGLLGDLCISSRGSIIISHGKNQKQYAEYKSYILNGFVKSGYSGYNKAYSNFVVHASVTEQTKLLRKIVYPEKKKTIKNILNYIDEIALAFWYMDDGCYLKNKGLAQFHTEGFTKADIKILSEYLQFKFNIKSYISGRKLKSGIKYILILTKNSSDIFFNLIKKYVCNSMKYKLPLEYRNETLKKINNERLSFSVKFVNKIQQVKIESYLYDIEVDKYHNFVANNTVVHNCDHLDGILLPDVALPSIKKKKLRPNDICSCGSGRKFKKCCQRK